MRITLKKVKNIFIGLAALTVIFLFSSCEIGLGESVDTETPTGAISSPEVDAVIRSVFAIKGTWTDDGTVSSAAISLKNNSSGSTATYSATVESSGSWYCEIDPKDECQPLVDGSYLATVVLTDDGGHTTTLTRSYTIDNTPPLIVLQRPSTKASAASADSFGQTFTVKGQAVDDNNVSKILVYVYEDSACTTLLKTITLSNVPANMEMDAATYEEGNTTNDYYTIYGYSYPNGTKELYCTLEAYDGAAYYPLKDSEASTDGNSTTTYYLYNDISTLISSYKSTGIYHILNGTYDGSSDTADAVISKLDAKEISISKFSLNPDNSPTFTVEGTGKLDSGSTILNENDELYTNCAISNDTKELIITISPGRDQISITADDSDKPLYVYLMECDKNGTITGTKEIPLIKAYLNSDGTEWIIADGQGSVTVSDSSYVLTTGTISTENYEIETYNSTSKKLYRVCVSAYDDNNNAAVEYNSKIYAFGLATSASTIETSVTSTPDYISASAASTNQTLSVTLQYSYIDSKVYIYRTIGSGEAKKLAYSENNYEFPSGENKTFTDSISVDDLKLSDGTYASKLIYKVVSINGEEAAASNNKTVNVKYDNSIPVLGTTTCPGTTETALSSFSFSGTASDSDSGLSAVYINITNNDLVGTEESYRTTGDLKVTGTENWIYKITSSDISSGGDLYDCGVFNTEGYKTVKVYAVDNVGLKSSVYTNTSWIYDTSAPEFTISSYISADDDGAYTESETSITTSTTGSAGFNTGKAFKLIGTASDDFGISSISVTQKYGSNSVTLSSTDDGGIVYDSDSGSWYIEDLPRSTGGSGAALPDAGSTATYTYTFAITDKGGTSAATKTLTVVIDREAPSITVSSPDSTAFGDDSLSGSAYTFRGTANDGSGLGMQYYKYAITDSATSPDSTDTGSWTTVSYTSSGNWSFSKSLGSGTSGDDSNAIYEGTKYIHVIGVDLANNESDPVTVSFCVDQSAPAVSCAVQTKQNTTDTSYTNLNEASSYTITDAALFRFVITAGDTNGISSVTASNGENSISLTDNGDGTWTSTDIDEQGTYSFVITATDVSGNGLTGTDAVNGRTTSVTNTVIFDYTAPSINSVKVNSTEIDAAAGNETAWYNSKAISVDVTASDSESEIASVKYAVCAPDAVWDSENAEWKLLSLSSGVYSGTVSFSSNGKNTLYIKAIDSVGNSTVYQTAKTVTTVGGGTTTTSTETSDGLIIKIDSTAPDLSGLFYQVGNGTLSTAGGTSYVNGESALTVYGLYKDDESGVNGELSFTMGTTALSASDITVTYSSTEPTYDEDGTANSLWITGNSDETNPVTAAEFSGYSDFTDPSEIKSWKAVFTPTKSGKLTVSGINAAGSETETTLFTISLDTTKPKLNNISLTTTSDTYSVYQPVSGTYTYYVNNTSGSQTFSFAGIATDNTSVDTVTLTIGTGDSVVTRNMDDDATVSQWSFSGVDLSSLSSGTTATVTATDIAGNTVSQEISIIFDITAPTALHLPDNNGKDIYYRVGSQNNDDITNSDSLWNDDLDKDVGGKYHSATYGNSTSIKIRGLMTDEGCGISKIYYAVYTSEPAVTGDELKSQVLAAPTGYISPLTTNQTRRVFYTGSKGISGETYHSSSGKYYATVESSFADTISGFSAGSNYLVLVAVDNVGNSYLDSATIDSTTYESAIINVDMEVPEISSNASSSTIFANGSLIQGASSYSISGTTTDNASGVAELSYTVGSSTTSYTANLASENSTSSTWTLTLDAGLFANASGNITIYGVATDVAGNSSSSISLATICVDKGAPTVTMKTPSDADSSTAGTQVNGKITLSGTASDTYLTEDSGTDATMHLYYTTSSTLGALTSSSIEIDAAEAEMAAASSAWRLYGSASHASSWEFENVDTTKLIAEGDSTSTTYIEDGSTVYFTVSATDKAGNTGYGTPLALKIDQDSDRPVLTFSSITLAGTDSSSNSAAMSSTNQIWVKTDTIYGTATDDDGVSAVYVAAMSDSSVQPGTSDWGSNIYSNGAWEYTADSDGYSVLYFKVVDTDGTEFISSASVTGTGDALLATPKLKDKASTVNRYGYKTGSGVTSSSNVYTSTVYIQIDTEDPSIYQTVWYTQDEDVVNALLAADSTTLSATLSDPVSHSWISISDIGSSYIGGPDSKIWIMYKSADTNGVYSTSEIFGSITVASNDGSTTSDNTGTKVYPQTQTSPYSTDSSYYTQVVRFDLEDIETSNSVNMALTVTDRAGRTYTGNYYFAVDNEAPAVEIRNYSDGDSVYGSLGVSVTGRTTENRSSIDKLYFGVTNNTTAPTSWTEFTDYVSTSSWTLVFDGEANSTASESTAYHTSTLNNWMDAIYGDGTSSDNESEYLYIWVYAEDTLGNTCISDPACVKLDVLTQGDKPSVTISYPSSGATAGGTIRVSGSTEINTDSVQAVWLQIDPSYDEDAGFNENSWATELSALINGKDCGYTLVTEDDDGVAASASTPGSSLGAGILASGSVSSWNLPINTISEFGSSTVSIAIRAYAVSTTNCKLSNYAEVYFTVDPNSPVFGEEQELILINAEDSSKTQKYTSGMWISGLWYLYGSITHGAGIKTLTKDTTSLVSGGVAIGFTDGTEITEAETESSSESVPNWLFKIPVGSSTSGEVGQTSFTLSAIDNTDNNNTASLSIKINYDNKAPSSFTPNGLSSTGNSFQQSNGAYSVKGTVVEGGTESGFARNAFYFTRDITSGSTTTRYFMDPMVAKGASKKANFVTLGTLSGDTFTAASGIVYDEDTGLYWRESGGASLANTTELSVSEVPDNVRVGGLCKIYGVIYRIEVISGTTLTIDGEFEDTGTGETITVYFALAQVIDNTTTESGTTGTYDSSSTDSMTNGDGDQMVEGISQNGTSYTWSASINLKNIYDGPANLHFSYFDAAGNCASAEYDGMISNNAPRLAGVTVWTDYNGDSSENAASETQSYWYSSVTRTVSGSSVKRSSEVSSEIVASSTGDTSGQAFMTVKDATEIRAEIIGGNGNLYYSYKIGTDVDNPAITGRNTTSFATGNEDYDDYTTTDDNGLSYVNSHTAVIPISLSDFTTYLDVSGAKIENSTAANPTWFQYTIWDETDGTTVFTDSQSASLKVALAVQVHDETNPVAAIKPFYWASSSDNSLYQNSTANGHIELEGDLPSATFGGSSGEYDGDPKVSGKIVVRGTAYDNIRLSKLYVKFGGHSALGDAFVEAAGYSSGAWTAAGTSLSEDGWTFAAEDTSYDSTGHYASWTLTVDTEFLSTVAGNDKAIEVYALDERGSLSSAASTTQTTSSANTPFYQVDVVPYITSISTSVRSASGLKDNNIRSASGKYSILANNSSNTISVSGFNFRTSNIAATIVDSDSVESTSLTSSSGTGLTISASDTNNATITNSSITKSGYLELFSNGVRALNNLNDNDSHDAEGSGSTIGSTVTAYSNYYNREPDYYTTKNVQLTDDRYLRFFDMKDTGVKNAYYPTMIMNGDNPVFGYVDLTGGESGTPTATGTDSYAGTYQPSHAMPQRSEFNGSTAAKVYTDYLIKASIWDQMGMAVDEGGRYYNVSVYNRDGAAMSLIYDRYAELHNGNGWGAGTGYSNYNGNWSYNSGNNAITLDRTTYGGLLLNRYQYPKLIAKGNSKTGAAYIYMSYYDDKTGEVLFRNFQVGLKASIATGTGKIALDSSNSDIYGTTYSQYYNFTEDTTSGAVDESSWDTGRLTVTDSGSKYFGMGVTDSNYVVIAYYDETTSKIVLKYSDSAVTGSNPTNEITWNTSSISFPSYVGQYLSMTVDGDSVHIAAFDAYDSNLVYMYIPSYNGTEIQKVTVDQSSSVGQWTQIKVKNSKPYIAYYNSTETGGRDALKLAYYDTEVSSTLTITNGADVTPGTSTGTGYTTGDWEYMTIPSISAAQGGDTKFQNVCLDFDTYGIPVIGYLGTNLEFGKWLTE